MKLKLLGVLREEIYIDVEYWAGFPRDKDGICALCHGDPCAESSIPDTLIKRFFAENRWADTCPMCHGEAS